MILNLINQFELTTLINIIIIKDILNVINLLLKEIFFSLYINQYSQLFNHLYLNLDISILNLNFTFLLELVKTVEIEFLHLNFVINSIRDLQLKIRILIICKIYEHYKIELSFNLFNYII
jgi:hypothetical protein